MAVAAVLVSRLCGFLCACTTIGVIALVVSASLSQHVHLRDTRGTCKHASATKGFALQLGAVLYQ